MKPRSSCSPFLTQSQQQIASCLCIGLSVLLHDSKERSADMKEMKGYKEQTCHPPSTQKYWAANSHAGLWNMDWTHTELLYSEWCLISSNPFIPRLCVCFPFFPSLHLHSPEYSLYFHAPNVVGHSHQHQENSSP